MNANQWSFLIFWKIKLKNFKNEQKAEMFQNMQALLPSYILVKVLNVQRQILQENCISTIAIISVLTIIRHFLSPVIVTYKLLFSQIINTKNISDTFLDRKTSNYSASHLFKAPKWSLFLFQHGCSHSYILII